MIFDKIENIDLYTNIPSSVTEFLKNLDKNMQIGRYDIAENIYVNVDKYNTKPYCNTKMEAHKKYIDIQLLLNGLERLDYSNIENLYVSEEYDEERDVMFFKEPKHSNSVILNDSNFIMLYPHDAHRPQISHDNNNSEVTKIVIKIKVD